MSGAVSQIKRCVAIVSQLQDFNAFGPFTFLPARVNMYGFACFFKEQLIFLNGGDPGIFHAWLDAYISLPPLHSAGLAPQFFHFFKETLILICTYRGANAT